MNQDIYNQKIILLLKDIYKNSLSDQSLASLISLSIFEFKKHWNTSIPSEWLVFDLVVHLDPIVYNKNFISIEAIERKFKNDINKISNLKIDTVKILPDLNKVAISNSEIRPVYTEWEEINLDQEKLINLLKTSSDSLDFMNIGNTSRSILQKVATIVYNDKKHRPDDKTIDVSPSKYKNRLHSYIKSELKGASNEELRQFAESAIETIEKSIDLSNTLAHKYKSERIFAEVCIIGTIGAISIIKLIENKN